MLKVCPYKCKESSDLNFGGKLKAIHSAYLIIDIVWYFQKKCDIDILTIFWKWHDNCITIYRQTIFWGLDVIFISDGKKTVENTQIWWCWVKIGEKWQQWKMGNYLLGQSREWYKINAIVQVLSTRKFWYPTRHHEFCMRLRPTKKIPMRFRTLWSCVPHQPSSATGSLF